MERRMGTMETVTTVASRNGLYVAHLLPGKMEGWGVGAIKGWDRTPAAREAFAVDVMDSLQPVTKGQLGYSDCTDGRLRKGLLDGSKVPNREKLVGADIMIAFSIAEALGKRFYANPFAPVEERIDEVVSFLSDQTVDGQKLVPSTHVGCGMAGGFVPVIENVVKFARVAAFMDRQRQLNPAYSDHAYRTMTDNLTAQLRNGAYQGYADALITAAVKKASQNLGLNPDKAIAQYVDDGRGVHGHCEEEIARVRVAGVAVDVNLLASKGHQVFSHNDLRMQKLAELFARGNDTDYAVAMAGAEAATDSGHGTLASGMGTIVIEAAR